MKVILLLLLPFCGLYAQDLSTLKKQTPFALSGNFFLNMDTYSQLSGGSAGYLNPFAWSVTGTPVVSIYGISMPVTLLFSNQNKAYSLPFSRFGLSPRYKWAQIHLGWRSLNFSPFTLGGQNIFGAGLSLTPGKWHLDGIYGKFNKAITDISLFNNLNNSNTPVYSRKGFAIQVGYGNEKNNVYISYLNAKDDSNSVSQDIKMQSGVQAASNQVWGIRSRIHIIKPLSWYIDGAASQYTGSQVMADSLGGSKLWWQQWLSNPNSSSRLLTALETGIQYSAPGYGLDLKYRRVDPNYQSMGAFYLQTDIEQYTINPSARLFKSKLSLTGSLGIQRDNLYQKSAGRNNRTIGLVGLSYTPNEVWGVDIQYSNFGISQQLLTKYVSPNPNQPLYDSVRIDQVSRSVTLSPHIILVNQYTINTISGTFSYQDLSDRNQVTAGNNNFNSVIAILTHTISFLRSKWQVSQSATYLNTSLSTGSAGDLGYTLGATKNLEKKKVTLTGNLSYYVNLVAGSQSGHTINGSAGAGIHIGQHQAIQAGAGIIDTNNKGINGSAGNHSTQLTSYLRYNFSF